jgi:Ca-activated chloride channel family protein
LFLLIGCSDIHDGLSILEGNYDAERGDFQKASLHYLEVQNKKKLAPWIAYDLGNVYNALGESNSALAVWNTVGSGAHDELLFRLWFNKGDLLYQKGLYQEAYQAFKKALLVKSTSLEAKRNLELCLLKIQSYGPALAPPPAEGVNVPTPDLSPDASALLDYVHRLEGNRWKSNTTHQPPASSSDW